MITVIDTETAGFKGPIMQVAYQAYEPFSERLMYWYNSFLKHDNEYEVHPDALAVHGFSYEHAQKNGQDATSVLRDIVYQLQESELVIGHKLQYDLAMISKDCFCYGVKFDYSMTDPRLVCTMARTKAFCNLKDVRGRPKFPNLSELHYRLFCEDFQGAHDALNDVRATAKCYFELKKRGIV